MTKTVATISEEGLKMVFVVIMDQSLSCTLVDSRGGFVSLELKWSKPHHAI
jgi:hypothetical protein